MEAEMKPDYGIDAPGLMRGFLIGGACAFALGCLAAIALGGQGFLGVASIVACAIPALYLTGMGGFMAYESKYAKPRERERLLDLIAWRGDERVLDVGCGRGLMLVGAARRLTSGTATGVDIWRSEDQSANTPDAALANAALEGVADRVTVETADMRALPFGDSSFDRVVSHWAIHNLDHAAERSKALAEMSRVLRAGGALILTDIAHRPAYAAALPALGFDDIALPRHSTTHRILGVLSFGSFRPGTILARKSTG